MTMHSMTMHSIAKRAALGAALGVAALTPVASLHAQMETSGDSTPSHTLLTVSGTGTVAKAPDIATFNASIVTTGASAAEALQSNSQAMQKLFAAIDQLGINKRDVQTQSVSLRPQFANQRDTAESVPIIGYRASNQVTLTSRDLTHFGKVIDALVRAGANQVSGPDFGLANAEEALDQARIAAVEDGQAKAALYARAAGMRVARIRTMSDTDSRASSMRMMEADMIATAASVPIAEGEVRLSARVTMTFDLAPL